MEGARPGRGTASRAVAVVLLVALAALLVPDAAEAARSRSATELAIEQALLRYHNEARTDPGRFYAQNEYAPAAPLTAWTDIREVARGWSDRMGAEDRMYHNPSYARQYGQWRSAGENVAYVYPYSYYGDPDAVALKLVTMWMNSSGHRRNIMNPGFDEFAVGVAVVDGKVWATTNFRGYDGRPRDASAARIPSDGTAQVPARPRGTAVARDTTAACPGSPPVPFVDVAAGNPHGATIACLRDRQVTNGRTATDYEPGGSLTRGQLATFLDRALASAGQALPDAGARDAFDDDEDSPHEAALDRLGRAGIFDATDGLIRPGARVSRAEMARWTTRALAAGGVPLGDDLPDHFGDDDGHADEGSIDRLAALGVITGRADGAFDPDGPLRRDQMATFLARAIAAIEAAAAG